jgi:hypothetical protein
MMGIANDDLLLFSVLTFCLVFLWDNLNRVEPQNSSSSAASSTPAKKHVEATPDRKKDRTPKAPASATPKPKSPAGEVEVSENSTSGASPAAATATVSATAKSGRQLVLPYLPGCEPDGPAAKEMIAKYPDTSVEDIVRYLVARKGNVQAASEMLEKCVDWRAKSFPLKRSALQVVYDSKVMFYHGTARDGTPVIYFRGGLYDKNKAPPETHVLGAAHCIDEALRQASTINVTVLVNTANVDGGPNAPADMNFIKAFVAVLSDNYPERLKRLILYPFPWWGRTIWSMVGVFLDKRTADKVVLLSGDVASAAPPPKELFDYVDAREIPVCVGGVDERPIVDMSATLS